MKRTTIDAIIDAMPGLLFVLAFGAVAIVVALIQTGAIQ